eukprot:TRINITY_DN481_c2_g1_i1.p1 TRINITY_DN481_c2_g1~~TRINITY_DN481_c2_g1_i1.p1  ORF type:complete len:339 (-),score=80.11 TRINITY_DN481_c2_g1_i1:238-1254(-)
MKNKKSDIFFQIFLINNYNKMDTLRVLSIQSHVIHGFVGNKAAVFPLQLLGFEVDFLNTVNFSNHLAYKQGATGQKLTKEQAKEIFEGLIANQIDNYDILLTGYCGDPNVMLEVADFYELLKEKNKNLFYLCDTVIGDNGKKYVPEEIIEIYKERIMPLSDFITPNHFEAELLIDSKITTIEEAKEACKMIHEKGPKAIIITGLFLGTYPDHLVLFSSEKITENAHNDNNDEEEYKCFTIKIPKVEGSGYVGTGDLFSALILGYYFKFGKNLSLVAEYAVTVMQTVLKSTYEYNTVDNNKNKNDNDRSVGELRIIQNKNIIENPTVTIEHIPYLENEN